MKEEPTTGLEAKVEAAEAEAETRELRSELDGAERGMQRFAENLGNPDMSVEDLPDDKKARLGVLYRNVLHVLSPAMMGMGAAVFMYDRMSPGSKVPGAVAGGAIAAGLMFGLITNMRVLLEHGPRESET